MSAADRRDSIAYLALQRGTRAGLCFLVFAATVAVVWIWGPKPSGQPTSYSASASVDKISPNVGFVGSQSPARCDQVKNAVLSETSLRRLLPRLSTPSVPADSDAASGDPTAQLRRNLDVTVSESPSGNELDLTIVGRGDDPSQVVAIVNELATMVADDHRRAATASATQAWQEAHLAAADAHQKLLTARAALDDFLAKHFREHQALAEKIKASAQAQSLQQTTPEPIAPSRTIANPEWVELERTRKQLADRREELLVTRTPQHPMIRDLDAKMQRIQQALASIPREIPDDADSPVIAHPLLDAPPMRPPEDATAETEPTATLGRVLPAEDTVEHGPAADKYRQLCVAADEAQRTYDRLADAEQAASEKRLELPQVELRLAQECQASRPSNGSSRVLLVALVAGLTLAVGAGMISTGLTAEPPFRTIAQAQAALPAPIVGVVPSEKVSFGDYGSRPASNRALAFWGLVLVAICLLCLLLYLK